MKKKNAGQSLTEALFVVVFTTIIMFAFLQVCIMVVDDMTANEAAFVAMRSAAVTKKSERPEEVKNRVNTYMSVYYPFLLLNNFTDSSIVNHLNRGSFVYSNKKEVADYFGSGDNSGGADGEESEDSVAIYKKNYSCTEEAKDYSGNIIESNTVKIYYFTRVMFGFLVAKDVSNARRKKVKDFFTIKADRLSGISGNRRYQSARNRMVVSPDSDFYERAYPGAGKFKNYDLSALLSEIRGE